MKKRSGRNAVVIAAPVLLALFVAVPAIAQLDLPQQAPAPQDNPAEPSPTPPAPAEEPQEAAPENPPLPTENPLDQAEPEASEAPAPMQGPPMPEEQPQEAAPAQAPLPSERPADADEAKKPGDKATEQGAKISRPGPQPLQGPPMPRELVGVMPDEEKQCRVRLGELGVVFEDRPAESGEDGCSLPWPISVKRFGKDIEVEPPVLVNCAIAETGARFLQDVVQPKAREALGTSITGIANGSGYVCRPRNGTQKLSEHALGNAFDIMAFKLEDGRALEVKATDDDAVSKFFDAVRKAACGPFKTVLGPGADADHANHFHLDLEQRRNGGTFCQ